MVVDDGSTDGVGERLQAFAAEADFPVRVFRQENGGKHLAWNRGVDMARGELFVPADSDDAFAPESLQRFRDLWLSIPAGERAVFSGVNVLCRDPRTGEVVGTPFPRSPMVSQNLELAYVHGVTGEKWGCIRTDVLRAAPFPAAAALRGCYVPESYVWFTVARSYKALCVNEPLRSYYRDAANSIMAERTKDALAVRLGRNAAARYFFSHWHLENNLDYLRRDWRALVKTLLEVWTSGLLVGASVRRVLRDNRGAWPSLLLLASLPAGLAMYGYCRLHPQPSRS